MKIRKEKKITELMGEFISSIRPIKQEIDAITIN